MKCRVRYLSPRAAALGLASFARTRSSRYRRCLTSIEATMTTTAVHTTVNTRGISWSSVRFSRPRLCSGPVRDSLTPRSIHVYHYVVYTAIYNCNALYTYIYTHTLTRFRSPPALARECCTGRNLELLIRPALSNAIRRKVSLRLRRRRPTWEIATICQYYSCLPLRLFSRLDSLFLVSFIASCLFLVTIIAHTLRVEIIQRGEISYNHKI